MPDLSFMDNLGGMITGLAVVPFVIVALVLVVIALRSRAAAAASRGWPSVVGTVLASQIEMRRSGNTGRTPHPVVIYSYAVDGKQYTGNRISFGGSLGGSMIAYRKIEQYPAGSSVSVYYNPANPADAVLEQTSASGTLLLWIAGIIILMLLCTTAMTVGGMGLVSQWVNQFTSGLTP
ncbi:MAG: DUF3592 domain-containing protein [Chloroflexi bacterium]|nr:DUF3592 domain-containing protein [Chloroflexota bacterium]